MPISSLELEFDLLWDNLFPNIDLETEQLIIPGKKYRFDYIHRQSKTAIEVNGGIYQKMGHSTGKGIERDYTKINLAQAAGMIFVIRRLKNGCLSRLIVFLFCDHL